MSLTQNLRLRRRLTQPNLRVLTNSGEQVPPSNHEAESMSGWTLPRLPRGLAKSNEFPDVFADSNTSVLDTNDHVQDSPHPTQHYFEPAMRNSLITVSEVGHEDDAAPNGIEKVSKRRSCISIQTPSSKLSWQSLKRKFKRRSHHTDAEEQANDKDHKTNALESHGPVRDRNGKQDTRPGSAGGSMMLSSVHSYNDDMSLIFAVPRGRTSRRRCEQRSASTDGEEYDLWLATQVDSE